MPAHDAAGVDLGAEADDVQRARRPGRRRWRRGLRPRWAAARRCPGRRSAGAGSSQTGGRSRGVDRWSCGGPPHLVVGGGGDLRGSARGAWCRGWRSARAGRGALRLDGAGVLDVPALGAAQVLPEPVEQPGEVDGVPGGAPVVVAVGVERVPRRGGRGRRRPG